jgi:hypothetical protein
MVLLHPSGMSQRATADEYHQRHPGQPRLSHHLTGDLLTRFKENGSAQDKPWTGRCISATGLANSVAVTAKVTASSNALYGKSQESAIGRSSVRRIFQRHKFHPYKAQIVQELHGDDTRLEFCEWFPQTREQQSTLEADIFSCDEA